jgi:ParB family transcriptional regulator, chromosome partitioning protein
MRSALGKGLNALISEETAASVSAAPGTPATSGQRVGSLPIDLIHSNPKQPRRQFDEASIAELASSIRQKGVLQPILVFSTENGQYEIIAGERRWRAARQAGLQSIPAIVTSGTEAERFEIALIENVQRQDLNPMEQADGYRRLQNEFSMTQEQIAQVIGKDRAVIANTLRLLNLPEPIRLAVSQEKISMGHARALLAIDDAAAQDALFQRILSESLPVRDVEQAAKLHKQGVSTAITSTKEKPKPSAEIRVVQEELQHHLGRKVELQTAGAEGKKGWLRLEFYSLEDLDVLINRLKRSH